MYSDVLTHIHTHTHTYVHVMYKHKSHPSRRFESVPYGLTLENADWRNVLRKYLFDRLHKDIAMLKGFQEVELFDRAIPAEYEANLFAAELLIDDNEVLELLNNEDMSFFDVARELYVPAALLDFKFRVLKYNGYRIEAPYIANGDFLKNDIEGCFEEDDDCY